jgi:hypothetical protein
VKVHSCRSAWYPDVTSGAVCAGLCFYLYALFMATDEIQRRLSAGTPVVVESYFARCMASHQALGAHTGITLPSGLPCPAPRHTSWYATRRSGGAAGQPFP